MFSNKNTQKYSYSLKKLVLDTYFLFEETQETLKNHLVVRRNLKKKLVGLSFRIYFGTEIREEKKFQILDI
jgi:hypothetical protein